MSNISALILTTIKPTLGRSIEVAVRNKEGEAKKPNLFVSYHMLPELEAIANDDIRAFAFRAYEFAVWQAANKARKDGKESFPAPSLAECFEATKREFLITKEALSAWLADFSMPILHAAIASKLSLPADSVKVVKRGMKYQEAFMLLARRGNIMCQDEIDYCIKALEVIDATGKENSYTDNISTALSKEQEKLNAFLARGAEEDEDEEDF